MARKNYLGDIINRARVDLGLTQDEYGEKFGCAGPVVFKFEKDYVQPSLELWLRIAREAGLSERRAVLVWLKSRLPPQYQDYVEFQGAAVAERNLRARAGRRAKGAATDYARLKDRQQLRAAALADEALPSGLRQLIADDESWALYKPTGAEINLLADIFKSMGRGSKASYREALLVLRKFREAS